MKGVHYHELFGGITVKNHAFIYLLYRFDNISAYYVVCLRCTWSDLLFHGIIIHG